jgi:hypothetical protein
MDPVFGVFTINGRLVTYGSKRYCEQVFSELKNKQLYILRPLRRTVDRG